MLVNVDFDVDLDVDSEVGLSHTRMRRLIHTMLTPDLDSRSPILMTWRDRAACLGEDPELFFPIGNGDPAFRQIEKAKSSAVAVRSLRSA
jgi:Transcription factor WhiB